MPDTRPGKRALRNRGVAVAIEESLWYQVSVALFVPYNSTPGPIGRDSHKSRRRL